MCGEVKSKKDDKTASTPLVTISDLQKMKQFEVIIMRLRLNPFKTKFIPYYQWNLKKYAKAEYPTREKAKVSTFDIREFVKEKKKEKLMEMMNQPGGAPNGGGMSFPGMMGGMPGMSGMPGMPGTSSMMGGMPRPNVMPANNMISNNAPNQASSGFNVDDLVKKIDAKIAEIEAEEKRQEQEQKANAKENKPASVIVDNDKKAEPVVEKEIKEEKISPKPVEKEIEQPRHTQLSLDELLGHKTLEESKPISKNEEPNLEVNIKPEITKEPVSVVEEDKIIETKPEVKPVEKPIIHEDNIPQKEIDVTDDQFFDDFFDD